MMRAIPVRIDGRTATPLPEAGIDRSLALGILVWMNLVALVVIANLI